jgi:glyoxylase-like metal-dependent hydrolase (beta-lactamase superfamily II)
LITVCAKGQRAAKAAEILVVAGHDVEILDGGMGAWGLVLESVATSFGDTEVVQFRRRGKGCLSYLLTAGSVAVVIDPVSDPTVYVEEASRRGATVRYVLDTHLHADHLSGARELAARSGATLLLNPADPFDYDYTPIEPGLRVELGGALHLTVGAVSTPGHTMGSTVYLLGDVALFTGDTLFLESVGRPDLADHAEEYAHALYRSLHQVVLELPDETAVFPAHYGESVPVHTGVLVTERLGVLRHRLAALALPEDEFVAWAVARVTDRPPNYKEIVKFNAGRSEMPLDQLRELELGPNRCAIAS